VKTTQQIVVRNEENRAAAVALLATAGGERLISYLEALWLKRGSGIASNHGEAGWALAMHQAIADLKRLREEGS
jgi:hypothetical protein